MITRLLLACLVLLAPVLTLASAPVPPADLMQANERLEEASLAFQRGDTQWALDNYWAVASSPFGNAGVWANAGTAAYRAGDIGRSVLAYRRALLLNPSEERAVRSLAVASPKTNEGYWFLASDLRAVLVRNTSPGLWVLLAQIAFLAACVTLAAGVAAKDRDARNLQLSAMAWSLVLLATFAATARLNHNLRMGGDEAVVMDDKAITRSEPRADAPAQLELPAGTLLELTSAAESGFVRFKLADGRAGFISTDAIEPIGLPH